ADRCLKGAHMSGMYEERFTGRQVLHDQLAGEFEPRHTVSRNPLQQEAAASENARSERLLEADTDGDLRRGAQKTVTVHEIFLAGRNLYRDNVAGNLRRERDLARILHGTVLGHKDASAAGDALEDAKQTSA